MLYTLHPNPIHIRSMKVFARLWAMVFHAFVLNSVLKKPAPRFVMRLIITLSRSASIAEPWRDGEYLCYIQHAHRQATCGAPSYPIPDLPLEGSRCLTDTVGLAGRFHHPQLRIRTEQHWRGRLLLSALHHSVGHLCQRGTHICPRVQ